MTTYARKIAEAVRDAAASVCEKTEDRYVRENWFKVPELQQSAETGARDCENAVKALDLDAIIAGVPEPQTAAQIARSNFDAAYKKACASSQPDDWMQAALLGQQLCNALDKAASAPTLCEQPQAAESKALVLERDLLKFQVERIKEVATSIHNFAHDKSTGPTVPDALWEVRSMTAQIINDECLTADISTEQCDALTEPQAPEPKGLTDEQILNSAEHRRYSPISAEVVHYDFSERELIEYVRALLAKGE